MDILALLAAYKYLLISPLVILEWPIVTLLCGYLVSLGHLELGIVYLLVVLGDFVSDVLHYSLGYYGGRRAIQKRGKYVGITPEKVEQQSATLHNHKIKTIFSSKMIYGIGGIGIVACGISKMRPLTFFAISLPITLLQVSIYLGIGYYFWAFHTQFAGYLTYVMEAVLALALLIGLYLLRKKKV